MTPLLEWKSELPPLLARLVDGQFTPEDRIRLNAILRQGDLPRRYYRGYMELHATFEWQITRQNVTEAACPWTPDATRQPPAPPASRQCRLDLESPPVLPFLNTAVPAPAAFFTGWPAAYLVATLIVAIGLVVGALVHVSQPSQIVTPFSPHLSPRSPLPSVVARITGMVDCVWEGAGFGVQGSEAANQKSEIISHNSPLHLGDRLALKSGLLELIYDTGARVILQGPVTYEVESPAGGYLSLGKLTAKLDKEVRGQRSAIRNLLIRNP